MRTPWSIRIEEQLEAGKVTSAVETLALLARQVPHPALEEFARFLSAHAAQSPDPTPRDERRGGRRSAARLWRKGRISSSIRGTPGG